MVQKNATSLITHFPFHIPQLGRSRAIRVLLPRRYRQDVGRRYPVIYLQDGQNLFEARTAAFCHWKLQEMMLRQPIRRQAILVGIDNGGEHRIAEYAPFRRGQKGGQGHAYLEFIENTLKPFIDSTYRTWPQRETTAIAGSSLGGLISLYAGLRFGHVFGKVGALSPSLWFNPDLMKLTPAAVSESCWYVSGSKTEMRNMAGTLQHIYGSLKTAGFPDRQIRVVLRDRGRHSESFWAREFKPMYEWLFPATTW